MACALVFGLAGCGGSGGDGGADPATALPPGPVYLELVVKPEGDQRERMEALAGKLLRTDDPGAEIVELLESLDETGTGEFERDVKPWLGERVGLTLTGFDQEEPDFVAALATTDTDAAADALAREAARKTVYKDTDYWVDEEGTFSAVRGDFVLFSESEAALKRALDLKEEGSLAKSRRFEEALARLPEEREGTIYFDLKAVVEEAGELGAGERQIFNLLLGGVPPAAIAVLVEADQLALESRGPAEQQRSLASMFAGFGFFGATPLMGELPGDTVAAVGAPDFGDTSKLLVNGLAGPLGGAAIAGQLEEELGIDLDRDVYGWIGDVALFLQGGSVPELRGGLLIGVRDPAAARRAIPRLIGALQLQAGLAARPVTLDGADLAFEVSGGGIPLPVFLTLAGDRAVIAVGRESAQDALSSRARLREADAWDRATGVLDGLEPALIVDAPVVLRLIEQTVAEDPDYAQVKPYLETLTVLAAGSGKVDDQRRSRFAVGVK